MTSPVTPPVAETAHITLVYGDQRVSFDEPVTDRETHDFLWHDGNYACDCNRSLIAREHGAAWPELECGSHQIEAVIEYSAHGD